MSTKKRLEVGTKIRYTGKFLANTGQYAGGSGLSKWIVQACECGPCQRGDWVATNEHRELYPDEDQSVPQWQHVARGNVETCK